MNKGLEYYKSFIDGLVIRRECTLKIWIKEKAWPQLPENDKYNKLLSELTNEQKDILCEIVQSARDGGIHDTLAYISDKMNRENLILEQQGIRLPFEPFDCEMNYDWVCRSGGDCWPDEG